MIPSINNKSVLENKFAAYISYAHVHTRVFSTILKLNICDLLEDGPKSAVELSKAVNIPKESIIRMCRFFVPNGLFIQETNGDDLENPIFKKTENSTLFTENGGLKNYGKMISHDIYYQSSASIPDLLITGKNAFSNNFKGEKDIWDLMKKEPDFQDVFNKCMAEVNASCDDFANTIDWSSFKQICDIGGNLGTLLENIIKSNTQIKGINYDLESVLQNPKVTKHPSITNVPGDFFVSIPSSECYILKHILHDWDENDCIRILKNVHKSIETNGKVYIFEFVVNPNKYKKIHLSLDIFLWNNYGGKERELFEFERIANQAGFKIDQSFELSYDSCIILSKQ